MQSSKEQQGNIRKPFSSDQCKEIEKAIEWERLEISSRKLDTPSECFVHRSAKLRTETVWS